MVMHLWHINDNDRLRIRRATVLLFNEVNSFFITTTKKFTIVPYASLCCWNGDLWQKVVNCRDNCNKKKQDKQETRQFLFRRMTTSNPSSFFFQKEERYNFSNTEFSSVFSSCGCGIGPIEFEFLVFLIGEHFPVGVAEAAADFLLSFFVRQSHWLNVTTTGGRKGKERGAGERAERMACGESQRG